MNMKPYLKYKFTRICIYLGLSNDEKYVVLNSAFKLLDNYIIKKPISFNIISKKNNIRKLLLLDFTSCFWISHKFQIDSELYGKELQVLSYQKWENILNHEIKILNLFQFKICPMMFGEHPAM
jgi:hypothetical protein